MLETAKFIRADETIAAPIFRKAFAAKPVSAAALTITAHGIYEAHINGERVGDARFTPGWTNYHKRLQVQTYDVTALMKEENTIEIQTAGGWYHGKISRGCYDAASARAVIAELTLTYEDGTSESIVTDETWQTAKSPYLMADIYDGITYDANVTPAFAENARTIDADRANLIPDEGEPVRVTETIPAVGIFKTPKGETVIDFGQEITGRVVFTARGDAGERIVIDHCEMLDADGNFYTENYRAAKARITYISDGKERRFAPEFSFWGFRYIRLTEFPGIPYLGDFTAEVIHSDMRRTGYFKCSNPLVNRLFENVVWGQRGNFLDIPTDCPQRDERLGWTGDAQVFCRTAAYNYDVEKFMKKWLHDLAASQGKNGGVPPTVPFLWGKNGDPQGEFAWADAATVNPWEVYKAYGDITILEEQFPSMCAWVDCVYNRGDSPEAWGGGKQYGDWLGLDAAEGSYRGATNDLLLGTAYLIYSAEIVVKAGRALGRDVSRYEEIARIAREKFIETYVGEDGMLTCDTQTAYVVALAFGIAPDAPKYAAHLAEKIKANGNKIQTGFIGTAYIMDALTENGYADVAYTLLLQTEFPSWLYSVRRGATTIWEHWDGLKPDGSMWSRDMNSFNHYAYGAVAGWMYGTMAGIRPDESAPGYANVRICPIPDARIDFVEASLETRRGLVKSAWKKIDGGYEYHITIPRGATADAVIAGVSHRLVGGDYTFRA